MSISVTQVDSTKLSKMEAMAIRNAEREAEAFQREIDDDNHEHARLSELNHIAGIMLTHREDAVAPVRSVLSSSNTFSHEEQDVLLSAAQRRNSTQAMEATRVLKWMSLVFKKHQYMQQSNITSDTAQLIEKVKV